MKEDMKARIDSFLLKIREVLPDFVLNNKSRTEEIMTRIEADIISRVAELSGDDDLSAEDLDSAIDAIPSIQKYADSFLERGKPRFYITEELAPTYFRTLLLAGLAIFLLTLIPQLMKIGQEPGGKIIGYVFSGLFTAAVSVFSFVTIAFVGMSKLGIFPEDFARFRRKAREEAGRHAAYAKANIAEDVAEIRKAREEIKSEWEKEREAARSEREERQKARACRREELREKIERSIQEERKDRYTDLEKKERQGRAGEIVGGIFGILFGFFLIVQFPFGILNQANPLFLSWLRVFGGLIVLRNLWKAVQALIPFDRIWARRVVYALQELLGLLNIPLWLWLRDNISVVPAFSTSPQGLIVREPSMRATEILYWVFTAFVVLTVIGAVVGFIKSMLKGRKR